MKRVWLDASCWVAASGSRSGGSALIVSMAAAHKIQIATSSLLMEESRRNILEHFGQDALQAHLADVAAIDLQFVTDTTPDEHAEWEGVVTEKDRHVLAGAKKAAVDILVTLDRKHILTSSVRKVFPIPVMDTREFLTGFVEDEPAT